MAILLLDSAFIAPGGASNTSAQLAPPAGKTTGDFDAGKITDDTNAVTVDITTDNYTELVWNVQIDSVDPDGTLYEFRVVYAGAPLDTYTVLPGVTQEFGPSINTATTDGAVASLDLLTAWTQDWPSIGVVAGDAFAGTIFGAVIHNGAHTEGADAGETLASTYDTASSTTEGADAGDTQSATLTQPGSTTENAKAGETLQSDVDTSTTDGARVADIWQGLIDAQFVGQTSDGAKASDLFTAVHTASPSFTEGAQAGEVVQSSFTTPSIDGVHANAAFAVTVVSNVSFTDGANAGDVLASLSTADAVEVTHSRLVVRPLVALANLTVNEEG